MSIATINTGATEVEEVVTPDAARPTGIYALPVVGPKFQQARDVTEGLRPVEGDSAGQVVAKRVAQGAIITGAAAVAAIVVL